MPLTKSIQLIALGVILVLAACSQTEVPNVLEPQGLSFVVNSTQDKHDKNPGDGICAAPLGNKCTLRAAIEESNASPGADAITVPSGTYYLSKGNLHISDSLVINGALKNPVVIDALDHEAVFELDNGISDVRFHVELHRLTMRNAGYTGIMNLGADLLVNRSIITENNPTVPANSAGILNAEGGTLELNQSIVTRNGHLENTSRGGALVNHGGSTALIIRSTLSANLAGEGGGIYNQGLLTVLESTVSNNRARRGSGGVHNDGYATFKNATIAFNMGNMEQLGSGSPAGGLGTSKGQVWLANTLIANNVSLVAGAEDCGGPITSEGYNLIQDPNGCAIGALNNLFGVDPLLLPLAFNSGPTPTHAIAAASPARDAGNPAVPTGIGTACEPKDQRGKSRGIAASGRCDIGAYEFLGFLKGISPR